MLISHYPYSKVNKGLSEQSVSTLQTIKTAVAFLKKKFTFIYRQTGVNLYIGY